MCNFVFSLFLDFALLRVTEGGIGPGENCFSDNLERANWLEIFTWDLCGYSIQSGLRLWPGNLCKRPFLIST